MSDTADVAADLYADPAFNARLNSGDYRVREAAGAELTARFKAAYPDPNDSAPMPTSRPYGGVWSPNPPASDASDAERGVPPTGASYSLPASIDRVPDVSSALRGWAHGMRMSVSDVAEIGREVERLAAGYAHQPDHVVEAMGRAAIEDLQATAEGQATLQRAREHWRRIELQHPALADRLAQIAGPSDRRFIELLGRTYRP